MTGRKTIVRRLLRGSAASGAASAMALGLMLAIGPTAAFAETKVSGTSQAVRIEAKDSSIEEILNALRNSFGLQYRSNGKLEKKITGNYAGPLDRVLTRILAGNDFVMKTIDGRIEVSLLAAGRAATATGAGPGVAPVVSDNLDASPTPAKPAAKPAAKPMAPAASPGSAAPLASSPGRVTNDSDGPGALPGSIAVADGSPSFPTGTKGTAMPMLDMTKPAVPLPTGTSATTLPPSGTPGATAQPLPVPVKTSEMPPSRL